MTDVLPDAIADPFAERDARIQELKARLEERGLLRVNTRPVELPLPRPSFDVDFQSIRRAPSATNTGKPGKPGKHEPRRRRIVAAVAVATAVIAVLAAVVVTRALPGAGTGVGAVCSRFDSFAASLQSGTLDRATIAGEIDGIAADAQHSDNDRLAAAATGLARSMHQGTASVAFMSARAAMADACGAVVS